MDLFETLPVVLYDKYLLHHVYKYYERGYFFDKVRLSFEFIPLLFPPLHCIYLFNYYNYIGYAVPNV